METTGYNRQNISDRTGFDLGDQFTSEQQLRDYFAQYLDIHLTSADSVVY